MIKEYIAKCSQAERDLNEYIRARYPEGAGINWSGDGKHAGRIFVGKVVQHSRGKRVRVLNNETDSIYWIHAYRIVE